MLALKSPVDLSAERGIAAESKIAVDVEIIIGVVLPIISAWLREPPVRVDSELIVVEIVVGIDWHRKRNQENRNCKESHRPLAHISISPPNGVSLWKSDSAFARSFESCNPIAGAMLASARLGGNCQK